MNAAYHEIIMWRKGGERMKRFFALLMTIAVVLSLCGCVSSSRTSSRNSSGYDYDKGYGYSAPKKGQSFSDYVKEQDPDLYSNLFK